MTTLNISYRAAEAAPPTKKGAGNFALYALLAPTFILLAVFCLVPFVIAIATSFYDYEVGGDAKFIGFSNYLEYLHDYTFLKSFGNMLFLTAFAVIVVMIMPLLVAKLIFSLSSDRASYIYRIVFLLPIVVPNVAVQNGQQGTFVYVVDQDSKVHLRTVQVGLADVLCTTPVIV